MGGSFSSINKAGAAPVQQTAQKAGGSQEEWYENEAPQPSLMNAAQLMRLQKTAGNQAVMQMMKAKAQGQGSRTPGTGPVQRQEDNTKQVSDLAKFRQRCQQFPKAFDSGFIELFEKYVNFLCSGNEKEGRPLLEQVLAHLNKVKAFEIPANVYDQYDGTNAADFTGNVNLWSKTNKYMPGEKAEETKGITLESSLAGFMFDGLDFGVDYGTSDLLKAQWKQVSLNFVKNAHGTVHAHLLIGVNKKSVLYDTEADVVKEKLKNQEVTKVLVNYYKAVQNGPEDFGLEKFKTVEVSNAEEWEKLIATTQSTVPLGEIMTSNGPKQVVAKIDTGGVVFQAIQNLSYQSENRKHQPPKPPGG